MMNDDKNKSGIYQIKNARSGKVYVGSAANFRKSAETREKLSQAKRGVPKSPEHIEKIRAAHLRRAELKRQKQVGFV